MTPPPRHNGERIDPALARPVLLPPGFATASTDFSTGFRAGISRRALVICRTNALWTMSCALSLAAQSPSLDDFSLPISPHLNHLGFYLNTLRPPHNFCRHNTQQAGYRELPLSSSKLRSGSTVPQSVCELDACPQTTCHPFTRIDAT